MYTPKLFYCVVSLHNVVLCCNYKIVDKFLLYVIGGVPPEFSHTWRRMT